MIICGGHRRDHVDFIQFCVAQNYKKLICLRGLYGEIKEETVRRATEEDPSPG